MLVVARNESANLKRLLPSVAGWTAEMVVVLNSTTDDSASVARSLGARVEETTWAGYRDTLTAAMPLATQPWVLLLDADEEVSPAMRADIEAFFTRGDGARFHGVRFPRKSWFLGRWITHGDWYPDHVVRLFRREGAAWTGTMAHARISVPGPVTTVRGNLLHYPFPTVSVYVSKINTFADDFARTHVRRERRFSAMEAAFRAGWRCFRSYVVKRGFLDGFAGLFVAAGAGFATLVRYTRLHEHAVNEAGRAAPTGDEK